jgi:phosphoesterase RecJ-like protein
VLTTTPAPGVVMPDDGNPSPDDLDLGIARLRQLLDAARDVLLVGHPDPDADCLGSCLALAEALEGCTERVQVVVPPPSPVLYSWLPGFERLKAAALPCDTPLVICLDVVGRERAAGLEGVEPGAVVNIDHHTSNTGFGDLNLVDPDASAAAQVCLRVLDGLGLPITPTMATDLYAGLVGDTGGFRHSTSARTLADGARLATLGADPVAVAARSYASIPETTLRLVGLCLAGLRSELDGRLVWAVVTAGMLRRSGAEMPEADRVPDLLHSIAGAELAVLFRQVGPRRTRISVRSDLIDAGRFCAGFGGGGHRRAAGAEIPLPLALAVRLVREAAERALAGPLLLPTGLPG